MDLSVTFSALGRGRWGGRGGVGGKRKKEKGEEEGEATHLSASVINATSRRLSPSRLLAVTQLNKCAVTPASPTCSARELPPDSDSGGLETSQRCTCSYFNSSVFIFLINFFQCVFRKPFEISPVFGSVAVRSPPASHCMKSLLQSVRFFEG